MSFGACPWEFLGCQPYTPRIPLEGGDVVVTMTKCSELRPIVLVDNPDYMVTRNVVLEYDKEDWAKEWCKDQSCYQLVLGGVTEISTNENIGVYWKLTPAEMPTVPGPSSSELQIPTAIGTIISSSTAAIPGSNCILAQTLPQHSAVYPTVSEPAQIAPHPSEIKSLLIEMAEAGRYLGLDEELEDGRSKGGLKNSTKTRTGSTCEFGDICHTQTLQEG